MQDVAQFLNWHLVNPVWTRSTEPFLSFFPNHEAAAAPFSELTCLSNSIINLPGSSNIRVHEVIHTSGQLTDIAQYLWRVLTFEIDSLISPHILFALTKEDHR